MFDPSKQDTVIVSVIVRTFDELLEEERFTTGRWTGRTGPHGETFELVIESPHTSTDRGFYHKEDLYELTKENIDKFIRPN